MQFNGRVAILKPSGLSIPKMYSIDDLLHIVHSDGADLLRLEVGQPPMVAIDGEDQAIEGPAITVEDAQRFLQCLADTRQRRDLRKRGEIEFIYRFRQCASFVVHAKVDDERIYIDIH